MDTLTMDGDDLENQESVYEWPAPVRLGDTIPEGDVHVSDLSPGFLLEFILMVYRP